MSREEMLALADDLHAQKLGSRAKAVALLRKLAAPAPSPSTQAGHVAELAEVAASDAPVWYDADAANAWANGYNTAIATAGALRPQAQGETMTTVQDAADAEFLREITTPRPIAEYHEDMGPVLWWCWEAEGNGLPGRWLGEPPYAGSPLDLGQTIQIEARSSLGKINQMRLSVGGWPGYHTHFTTIPVPQEPK